MQPHEIHEPAPFHPAFPQAYKHSVCSICGIEYATTPIAGTEDITSHGYCKSCGAAELAKLDAWDPAGGTPDEKAPEIPS